MKTLSLRSAPWRRPLATVLLGLGGVSAALAGDAFTDAMQAAYGPYRAALFRTNGQDADAARLALQQARSAWATLTERQARPVGAPYDRDAGLGATLAEVQKVYDQAEGQVQAGQLAAAHETLERVRDLLADLRHRNGVVVYSDVMNAYHEEMEHLLKQGPGWLAQPAGLTALAAQAGVLDYLARRLRSQAPAEWLRQPEFEALLKDLEVSVGRLKAAAMAQDGAALKAAIGAMKLPYSKLFLKFG